MCEMTYATCRMTLSSPEASEIKGPVEDAIVQCLAAAFGSGVWAQTPMPIGDAADPHSARGIVTQLGARARVLVASTDSPGGPVRNDRFIGCVLGCVLDKDLIDLYRLNEFDAEAGDALLAYIGIEPANQGCRALPLSGSRFAVRPPPSDTAMEQRGESLAGVLFSRWLALPNVAACPRVFVRTRSVLRPVVHMIKKNGFDYRGKFYLDFHGKRQHRLVFARSNLPKTFPVMFNRTAALPQQMMV